MFLKQYQQKVVRELQAFFLKARETQSAMNTAVKALPENMRHTLNWVDATFQALSKPYNDKCVNGLREFYPRIVMKVPTGGGKTLLAVEAIREYQNFFAQKRTGLVVWIVPSETIYAQTVSKLRDKGNPLRQLLDQSSGGKTLILEKGQRLTTQDIEDNLVILFVMIQSISRQNNKESLKVFQDSGGYESFFPPDHRYDLHDELIKAYPNLDLLSGGNILIRTSLGNAIRVSHPMIIIDEIHKVFSDTARKTIDSLNPRFVLGLSATPKTEMNIFVSITGLELKEEDMVKLDMHIITPASSRNDEWKPMLKEIQKHREALEKKARRFHEERNIYIRPIALIQVEATGKDQRGKGRIHSLDVKEYLISLGINADEIGIKTSAQNDIEDQNLLSSDCAIRYLITKEALREGWDCSFAYILGIIPNVNSDTAITQLIGRILRQPNAEKTGLKELDESYVYYAKGDTLKMLKRVEAGFAAEGLEDLITKVKISGESQINQVKTVKIRKELRKKYESAFYLPVWVMIENDKKKRRFSYDVDIKPFLSFEKYDLTETVLQNIQMSLSAETKERKFYVVSLTDKSKFLHREEKVEEVVQDEINVDYLTRRYTELVENPFLGRTLAGKHLKTLQDRIGSDVLKMHYSFIVSRLYQELESEKIRREESYFMEMLNSGKVVLAVSNEPSFGYEIPDNDTIPVSANPLYFKKNLYEGIDKSTLGLNSLEYRVAEIFEQQDKLIWWFRNKANRTGYAIQGWQEYKIRPDFVAAKKKDDDSIELVYIIESKGEYLVGNRDTTYKKHVLDLMTEQKKNKKIAVYKNTQLPLFEVNEKVESYLVEEGKEEETIRRLFN